MRELSPAYTQAVRAMTPAKAHQVRSMILDGPASLEQVRQLMGLTNLCNRRADQAYDRNGAELEQMGSAMQDESSRMFFDLRRAGAEMPSQFDGYDEAEALLQNSAMAAVLSGAPERRGFGD